MFPNTIMLPVTVAFPLFLCTGWWFDDDGSTSNVIRLCWGRPYERIIVYISISLPG